MTAFFVNWQDPETRRWYPVAKLLRVNGHHIFCYTHGALGSKKFVPFGNMSNLKNVYVSETLFPIFANRVLSEKRPEFQRYAAWSGMPRNEAADPLLLMARMGGARATDTLQVYPVPTKGWDGCYRTLFFLHGLSHLPDQSIHRVMMLGPHEQLYPMLDIQNPFDPAAIAVRTGDPATLVGYVPRYLTDDIGELAKRELQSFQLVAKQVNFDAPPQFRLLCEVTSKWPHMFDPCDDQEHRPIVDFDPEAIVRGVRHQPPPTAEKLAALR